MVDQCCRRPAATHAIRANPQSTLITNQYGYELLWAGRYPEALRQFEANAKLRPTEPNPHDSLGEAYLFVGQPEKSLESYARALEIDPGFQSRQGRSWAFGMLGRYDEAIEDLRIAVDQAARAGAPPTAAVYTRAFMLSRVGRYREAARDIEDGMRSAEAAKDVQVFWSSTSCLP